MPRCLRLHKVSRKAQFCAVCGARVLPGWILLCLYAFPLALAYGVAITSQAGKIGEEKGDPIIQTVFITVQSPRSEVSKPAPPQIIEVIRTVEVVRTVEVIRNVVVTATDSAQSAVRHTPNSTPTPTPTLTPAPTFPQRTTLLSYHDLYVNAKGEPSGWKLEQAAKPDKECGWFTVLPLSDGRIALKTCNNRYVTSPRTGMNDREAWVLRQETGLSECGKFTPVPLGDGLYAFSTCADRYFTAGDDSWGNLNWSVVAETKEIKDWEKFTLQASDPDKNDERPIYLTPPIIP